MSNYKLSNRGASPLSPPLSGGAVHKNIRRAVSPIFRSAVGASAYPVAHVGAAMQPMMCGAVAGGSGFSYLFAFTDNRNFSDTVPEEAQYWTDQLNG